MTVGWTIEAHHLDHARRVVGHHAVRTPVRHAPELHPRLWLKLETAQHTGSFKVRGALSRLASLTAEEREVGVIAASAGNHGMGLAWAGARLCIPVRVVVPRVAPAVKRDGIAALGAELRVVPVDGYDEAEEAARREANRSGRVYVSPYDDPWVAAGNGGTLGLEVLEDRPDTEVIVAPVGGGGLMSGLGAATGSAGRDVRLIGVQSEACPAMARSLQEGHAMERCSGAPTLAEGLEGGVSATAFANVARVVERVDLVSESEIAAAMRRMRDHLGMVVEGSAATTIAWAARFLDREPGTGAVVAILTGRNVDQSVLDRVDELADAGA
jgi:threonine dehydratase